MIRYKIIIVTRWPVGGIRTYLKYVYNNMESSQYHLVIIAPNLPETAILLKDLENFDLRYIPVNENPKPFEFARIIWHTLREERFSLMHSHGLTAGLCALFPALVFKTPHLLTIHDMLLITQFKGIKGYVKKVILSLAMPMFDKIHTVSNDSRINIQKHIKILGCFKDKIVTIRNGIEVDGFLKAKPRDLRDELALGENTYLIGFLGRFMSPKGFIYLVEALDILYKKYNLIRKPVLITFGEGAFIREEQANVANKGLENMILFLPFCPNIASTLKGLDLVVMPSLWEACGLLAMETMVAGVPLIGTDCIGLREVLEGTPCKTVPTKNSEALAKAIYQEMTNPSKTLSKDFCREATKRFDVSEHRAQIENLFFSMIKNR